MYKLAVRNGNSFLNSNLLPFSLSLLTFLTHFPLRRRQEFLGMIKKEIGTLADERERDRRIKELAERLEQLQLAENRAELERAKLQTTADANLKATNDVHGDVVLHREESRLRAVRAEGQMSTLSSGMSRLGSDVNAINKTMGDVAKKADLEENQRRLNATLEQRERQFREELEEMMTRQQEQREAEQTRLAATLSDSVVKQQRELFCASETGMDRRRADDLEIQNSVLRAEIAEMRRRRQSNTSAPSTNRVLFQMDEEAASASAPPVLSDRNTVNLPPSAAVRSNAAAEKHVNDMRRETERKKRAADAASKLAPLPPVPTPRKSARKSRQVVRY